MAQKRRGQKRVQPHDPPIRGPKEWILNPPRLHIRVREEAEAQGYTMISLHRAVQRVHGLGDASIRRIWYEQGGNKSPGIDSVIGPLAIVLNLRMFPDVGIIGDPQDGYRYMFWWMYPTEYPAAMTDPLPDDEGA
jgi:hypothetical protein